MLYRQIRARVSMKILPVRRCPFCTVLFLFVVLCGARLSLKAFIQCINSDISADGLLYQMTKPQMTPFVFFLGISSVIPELLLVIDRFEFSQRTGLPAIPIKVDLELCFL